MSKIIVERMGGEKDRCEKDETLKDLLNEKTRHNSVE